LAYVGASVADDLPLRLDTLVRTTSARAAALRDAGREPGEHGERLLQLKRDAGAADALVDDVGLLVRLALEAANDRAPSLVRSEVQNAAETLAQAARAVRASPDDVGFRESLVRVTRALSAVDAAFSVARERRATAELSTEELARLLSVIRALHGATLVLSRFGAEEVQLETDRI
jgi:hypothetical protein